MTVKGTRQGARIRLVGDGCLKKRENGLMREPAPTVSMGRTDGQVYRANASKSVFTLCFSVVQRPCAPPS